jgi:hypothetical protein
MKQKILTFLFTAFLLCTMVVSSGCQAHQHVIGNGGGDGTETEARQWYVLWGLVPINDVDSSEMAAGASDYTIETEITPLDFVINIFTSIVTVYSRTVTVTQ